MPMPNSATATKPATIRPRQRVTSTRSPAKPRSGGKQGDRGDHRDEHGDRDADAHPGDPPDPDQEQAEERHDDGDAGEDHGPAGGVHRGDGRLAGRAAGVESLPVAGDDEQGVVDADAEPDHDPEEGGEVGDVEDVAEDDDQAHPGPDSAEGDRDGQAHREDRAEGEDQHDDGEGEADELGRRRFEDGEGRATGEHLEALDGGRVVGDRLAEGGRLGQVDIGGEVDLGVGELPGQRTLLGDLRLALLGVGGDDGGAGVLGVAVLVGEPGVHGGEELLHAGRDGGVVDALVGAEDDRSRRAAGAELGEVLLEHVEAVGALGVGDVGRRVVGGADRAGGAEDDDQGGEPDADGGLAVVVAPGADAGES